jgi:hypothetical protein
MTVLSSMHSGKQILFALLSAADLALTWALIAHGRGLVYEGNPVAAWVLHGHGWVGLAAYKLATVGLALALTAAVACYRPHVAGRLLAAACTAAAVVVGYSGYLGLASTSPLALLRDAEQNSVHCAQALDRMHELHRFRDRLTGDLARGGSLGNAVAVMEPAAPRLIQPRALAILRRANEDRPLRECLALMLMGHAADVLMERPEEMLRLAERLDAEFRAAFGRQPSSLWRDQLADIRVWAAEARQEPVPGPRPHFRRPAHSTACVRPLRAAS